MIRGKVLLWSLLLMGIIASALGIAQMWWEPFAWDIFVKTLITIVVLGTLASLLIAIDYDLPGSKGKFLLGIVVLLATLTSGLVIGQLWWSFLETIMFWKVLITLAILVSLLSFIVAVSEDFGTNKKLKDDKYID